jgi:hypothetical protein
MLASTVQFSNNDQPPITPNQPVRVHWGRHRRNEQRSHPQIPNSVPGTPHHSDQLSTPLRRGTVLTAGDGRDAE